MLLSGKRGLVLGIANKRSIAWGIAQAVSREGARLAVTYQGERLEENVRELAQGLKDPLILPCDVARDEDLDALAASVRYLAADLGPRGIRVNAISAGPIKTLAASGVHGLSKMLEYHRTHAPLRKNTEQDEVGDVALFLVSALGRGVTGEVIHVDGGFHVMGMAAL